MSEDEFNALSDDERREIFGDAKTRQAAADEFMAFSGQGGEYRDSGRWSRVVSWVRDALRRLGLDLKLNLGPDFVNASPEFLA
jgi:hypothetical protein